MKTKLLSSLIVASIIGAIGINYSLSSNNSSELELKYLLAGDVNAESREGHWNSGVDSCAQRDVEPHETYTINFTKRGKTWKVAAFGGEVGGSGTGGASFTYNGTCIRTRCVPTPKEIKGSECWVDDVMECARQAAEAQQIQLAILNSGGH